MESRSIAYNCNNICTLKLARRASCARYWLRDTVLENKEIEYQVSTVCGIELLAYCLQLPLKPAELAVGLPCLYWASCYSLL